jgi:hypothetical protein
MLLGNPLSIRNNKFCSVLEMVRAYISAPFTEKSTAIKTREYGEIRDESYKNLLEIIDSVVRGCGLETCLANRDVQAWGKEDLALEEVDRKRVEEISKSDVLIAYPENSRGVNLEIGWASMMKKKIIIMLNEKEAVSLGYRALNGITQTRIIQFKDILDMKNKLADTLREFVPKQ